MWRNTASRVWIPLVTIFGFSMTLLSLIFGQVNTLVVLGLALFTYFSELRRDYAAGASLALTTIKPHLVLLTLPLLIIDIVRRRQWRVFIGFVGVLAGAFISCLPCIRLGLSVFGSWWPWVWKLPVRRLRYPGCL